MKKILLFAAAALTASGAFAAEKVLAEVDFTTASGYSFFAQGVEPKIENNALVITNETATDPFYNVQYMVADGFKLTKDTEYTMYVKIKGFSGPLHYNLGTWDPDTQNYGEFRVEESSDWQNISTKVIAKADTDNTAHLLLQSGEFVGTFYIESVKITYNEDGETPDVPVDGGKSLITGGVAANGETNSIRAGWSGAAKVVADPAGEGVVYECPIAENDNPTEMSYASQLFIVFNEALNAGDKYSVKFDYYCTDSRTITIQAQGNPGEYHWWTCGVADLKAKAEWQSVNIPSIEVDADMAQNNGFKTIAFNLASAAEAATFYINNVVVEKLEGSAVEAIAPVKAPAGVYNLNGVKVADELNSNLPKGIYIVGGKKVVR